MTLPLSPSRSAAALPPRLVLRAGWSRVGIEIRDHLRRWPFALGTLLAPVALLLICSFIFSGRTGPFGLPLDDIVVCGYVICSIVSPAFSGLITAVATDRANGRLAQAGVPYPSYLIGKAGFACASGLSQAVLLLPVSALRYGVGLPGDLSSWWTILWVIALAMLTSVLAGVALSGLALKARAASWLSNGLLVLFVLTSGVFAFFSTIPSPLQAFGAVFPLKWMAQGMRSALLPEGFRAAEVAGSWEQGHIVLVLGAWILVCATLCILSVRRWSAVGRAAEPR